MTIGTAFLLQSDARLAHVIEAVGPLPELQVDPHRPEDHFEALARIVVGQQLSTHVAKVIWGRVAAHFEGQIGPDELLDTAVEILRGLGLSRAKALYLQALAAHAREGRLNLKELPNLSEAEVIREITTIKGFGPWSADMFLMFQLHRPDVLPVGDLGIREAIRRLHNLEQKPEADQMRQLSQPWRPHRTLACRYLWRYLDL